MIRNMVLGLRLEVEPKQNWHVNKESLILNRTYYLVIVAFGGVVECSLMV